VKKTTHSQNILHVDSLYNIKRKKYKTAFAELAQAKEYIIGICCFSAKHAALREKSK
jgi:hypothetical protein